MNDKNAGRPCTYMLRCSDGTLYTGWTNDITKRLAAHNAGKGAKYTKSRTPVELVYVEFFDVREAAMRREYAIKQLSRTQKLSLIGSECCSSLSGPGAALLSHRVVMRLPPRHAVPPPTPGAVPPGNQIRASLPLHYSARPGLSAQQRPRLPEVPLLQISRLLCPRLAAGPSGIRIQTASKIRRWFRKE